MNEKGAQQLENAGFIPITAITEIRRGSDEPDHYQTTGDRVDENGGLQSYIALTENSGEMMSERGLYSLFDHHLNMALGTRSKFNTLISTYTEETGLVPIFQLRDLEGFDVNYQAFEVSFDDELLDWFAEKYKENPMFLETPPLDFDYVSDNRFYTSLLSLLTQARDQKNWQDIGAFSSERLKALSRRVRSSAFADMQDGQWTTKNQQQVDSHEKAHYIQSQILFYGVLRDLMSGHLNQINSLFNKLYTQQREKISKDNPAWDESQIIRTTYETITPNTRINELLIEVRDLDRQLSGLMEADSMLVECTFNEPVISRTTKLDSSTIILRIANILGDFKRSPVIEKSGLERDIYELVDSEGAKGSLQEHIQGTLILLSKGAILNHASDLPFDFRVWGESGKDVVQKILSLLETFSDSYFDDLNPARLQYDIREKIRECLQRLTNTVRKLYLEVKSDQSGFPIEIDTTHSDELDDFETKLQKNAQEFVLQSLEDAFLGKPIQSILKPQLVLDSSRLGDHE